MVLSKTFSKNHLIWGNWNRYFPSANDYENSVVWDFHKVKEEWVANFDFVYTNSHDQSFKPSLAIETWLNQLKPDGYLFIEHSEDHGPRSVGEMDPFEKT